MPTRNDQRHAVWMAIGVLAACGPKPSGGWAEYEPAAQTHHTAEPRRVSPPAQAAPAAGAAALGDIDTLDGATAVALVDQLKGRSPAAQVALRAARLAHHVGDDAQARALLARAALAEDEPQVRRDLAALAAQLDAATVDEAIVAVLLPLSGRYAAVGSELRAAIELAPAQGTTWLFLDTRGEPTGATAAVERAVAKGAVGILGPVGVREVAAAARAAALRRVPIALLAPGDGADPAAGVFRFVNSPADEARAVAVLARAENFSTVAAFVPRDDIGLEAADAFTAEAQRLHLAVAATGSYDPTGGDVESDVKRFLNLVPATNSRLADHLRAFGSKGWQTFSPDIGFSLLYIPDRYDRAAVVAAFLPYFGVELHSVEFADPNVLRRKHGGQIPQVVQLVGGSGWRHPSLPVRGGTAVQGAWIVDVFAGDLGGETAGHFAAAFQNKTGRAPSSAAAEAFDAATLLAAARAALHRGRTNPRDAFRSALASATLEDGACGSAAIDSRGELVRTPLLLEVQGDDLRIVD